MGPGADFFRPLCTRSALCVCVAKNFWLNGGEDRIKDGPERMLGGGAFIEGLYDFLSPQTAIHGEAQEGRCLLSPNPCSSLDHKLSTSSPYSTSRRLRHIYYNTRRPQMADAIILPQPKQAGGWGGGRFLSGGRIEWRAHSLAHLRLRGIEGGGLKPAVVPVRVSLGPGTEWRMG